MKEEDPEQILKAYTQGQANEREKMQVESWFLNLSENQPDHLLDDELELLQAQSWKYIKERNHRLKLRRTTIRIAAAAALLICSFFAFRLYTIRSENAQQQASLEAIQPGGNRAFLTLSNGKRIDLDKTPVGEISKLEGLLVEKNKSGLITYVFTSGPKNGQMAKENTLETPVGGQYAMVLPEGTKVWLNASSKLTFPENFSPNQRVVKLVGEAYFEVSKDKKRPFLVNTPKQQIKVLGTHFNVSSYNDEPHATTTLLEGSISLSLLNKPGPILLVPGDRATLTNSTFKLFRPEEPNLDIMWKDGEFAFDNEPVERVMRKLERWYDVKAEYEKDFRSYHFTGRITRFAGIGDVLHLMESTGLVKFKIKERRISVMN